MVATGYRVTPAYVLKMIMRYTLIVSAWSTVAFSLCADPAIYLMNSSAYTNNFLFPQLGMPCAISPVNRIDQGE
jgi:predicted permease